MPVADELLTPKNAAKRLGIAVTTLYDWLGQSDAGILMLHGERVTVRYYQSGRKGQGRIRLPSSEVDRLQELMLVRPHMAPQQRRAQPPRNAFPGINVPLGRPD